MNLSDTKMARNRVEWNPLRYNKFELVRVLNWGRPQSTESKRRFLVAPHTGHVSNFRGLKRSPLEPVQLLSGQWRTRKTGVRIQTGHPVWTRFEPSWLARNPWTEWLPSPGSRKATTN